MEDGDGESAHGKKQQAGTKWNGNLVGGPSSYKDKLLSLGDSGFLVTNMAASEAMNGWRDYFEKMSEKQKLAETQDEDGLIDESVVENWSSKGKLPSLQVSAEEYEAWCKPYSKSLIVKLMGKSFSMNFLKQRIEKMWGRPGNPIKVMPLSNGYLIVSFTTEADRDFALQEGPWMIGDHYLLVQRWRPNFNPWKADNQKKIAAWIRVPNLPSELYNVESLRRIGNLVGRTLKIDRTTAFSEKGGFARICVEVDLQRPLLPAFFHFGEEFKIVYEGLHLICFTCGKYGHRTESCPFYKKDQEKSMASESNNPSQNETTTTKQVPSSDLSGKASPEVVMADKDVEEASNPAMEAVKKDTALNGMFGPHMVMRRDFSKRLQKKDIPSSADLKPRNQGSAHEVNQKKKEVIGSVKEGIDLNFNGDAQPFKTMISQDYGKEGAKDLKQEWVRVGSKRKVLNKRRPRGKEYKGEDSGKATSRFGHSPSVDLHGCSLSSNPFELLKNGPSLNPTLSNISNTPLEFSSPNIVPKPLVSSSSGFHDQVNALERNITSQENFVEDIILEGQDVAIVEAEGVLPQNNFNYSK